MSDREGGEGLKGVNMKGFPADPAWVVVSRARGKEGGERPITGPCSLRSSPRALCHDHGLGVALLPNLGKIIPDGQTSPRSA